MGIAFTATTPPPPASGWAGLPRDVLWSVFTALGQREVLSGAGLACAPWWRLARHEPAFWRRIDLTTSPNYFAMEDDDEISDDEETLFSVFDDDDGCPAPIRICQEEKTPTKDDDDDSSAWKAMALAAVDRSAGNCEAFCGRADVEVLLYLADRASSMKSLRVTSHYNVSSEVFAELIKKFPLLEELELVLKYDAVDTKSEQPSTTSLAELFQSTCKACCHLQHFMVRRASKRQGSDRPTHISIPIMHGLHSVELSGDSLSTDVVTQIVNNCPSLKSLNISKIHYQDHTDEKLLRNRCYRIKDLRLPAGRFCDYDSDGSLSDFSDMS